MLSVQCPVVTYPSSCQIVIGILDHISRCVSISSIGTGFASNLQHLPFVSSLDCASVPVWHLSTSPSLSLFFQSYAACCQWVPRRRWRRSSGTTPPYHATTSSRHPTLSTSSGYCRSQTPNRKWWDKIPCSVPSSTLYCHMVLSKHSIQLNSNAFIRHSIHLSQFYSPYI